MINLNLIPEYERKSKSGILSEGIGIPMENLVGILIAAAAVLVMIHVSLGGYALVRVAQHELLLRKWNSMGADKKVFDEISQESRKIQTRFGSLQPITSKPTIIWSRLLNDISDSVPKGVWLREVIFEKSQLTISGTAVSKMKNEMISAGTFVSALKERPSIKKNFGGVDIDSIQRRENTALSMADFTLKAKQK